jgi:hypothetical protein
MSLVAILVSDPATLEQGGALHGSARAAITIDLAARVWRGLGQAEPAARNGNSWLAPAPERPAGMEKSLDLD